MIDGSTPFEASDQALLDPEYRAALVDLFGVLAYGELGAFERLAADAAMAPRIADKAALAGMATAEYRHFLDLRQRLVELGAEPLSRDEVDGHVQRLSRDPIRWSRLEEQVEERAEELRREARPRPASSDEPRGAVVTE